MARLPFERDLARQWGISRYSLNRATAMLIGEGVIERRGRILFPGRGDSGKLAPAEPFPFQLYVVVPVMSPHQREYFERLLSRNHCKATFHCWRDITQSWSLFERTRNTPCEGAILTLNDYFLPANAGQLINELVERRIAVVCNNGPPGRASQLMSDPGDAIHAAVRQLAQSGHRRLLIPHTTRTPNRALRKFPGRISALELNQVEGVPERLRSDATALQIRRILARHLSGASPVTALLCTDPDLTLRFYAVARKMGVRIPGDLSILSAVEARGLANAETPVSAWCLNLEKSGTRLAIELLVAQIRHLRDTGQLPPPETIRIEPTYIDRGSVGRGPGIEKQPTVPVEISVSRWPSDPLKRRQQVEAINQEPYSEVQKAGERDWVFVDLAPFFNRQFSREHGWVADMPLLQMPRDRQIIHGVPFRIAGGYFSKRNDCLLLKSNRAHTSAGKPLPSVVNVPVHQRIQSVYFLHACGWATKPGEFASYEFQFSNGTRAVVPLVSYGSVSKDTPHMEKGKAANIQDWWPHPGLSQFKSANARHYVVTDGGDPYHYERYLYTLRWINPHPKRMVERLVIRSDPKADATLGILAVTAGLWEQAGKPARL